MSRGIEEVILVDDDGVHVGRAPKDDVHSSDTPLHLAFSCYALDDAGKLLVTRRALSKKTWPGVWTNSYCGHPSPGESLEQAVARRARQELGTTVSHVEIVLPEFRYRAVDASGIVENELCPVFIAAIDGDLSPNPDEVAECAWVHPETLLAAATAAPFAFSPWMVRQLPALMANGALTLGRAA